MPIILDEDISPLAHQFQMENNMEKRQSLKKQSEHNINIREKRGIYKSKRRFHHHSKMPLICNNCNPVPSEKNVNRRKKLHAHTIDHLTRKHRPYKIDPRSA